MTYVVLSVTEWMNLSSLVHFFSTLKNKLTRVQNIRKTVNELSKLSDRELADIGISRGMIRGIALEMYND